MSDGADMAPSLDEALNDLTTGLSALRTAIGEVDSVEGRISDLGTSGRDLIDGLTDKLLAKIRESVSETSAELARASSGA